MNFNINKLKFKKIILIFLAVAAVFFVSFSFWLAKSPLTEAKQKILETFALPLVIVDNKIINSKEYFTLLKLAKNILAAQSYQVSAGQLNQLVYNRLLDEAKLKRVSANSGVNVNQKDLDRLFEEKNSSGNINDEFNIYNTNKRDYESLILYPQQLQINLQIWYNTQKTLNETEYGLAEDLIIKINGGISFGDLAKAYSQDQATKSLGGDLGYNETANILPELRGGLDQMKSGEIKILVSRLGLHIVELIEKDNRGQSGAERIHLKQIFIKPSGFQAWYENQTNQIKIKKIIAL